MELTRINTALSRLMRKKWVWFILVIAGFWTASHVWDYYKLLSGQTPMYDVAIKLKVGDELVEINRTVPCLEIPQGEALPYLVKPSKWFKRPFRYFSRDMSTGAELEDGQGVMVTIPTVCDLVQKAKKEEGEGNVLPEGFMPMVALLDNADDPQVVKLIASRSYYRRDDREIDLLEYDITPSPKWAFPSFMDKFNWLRGRDAASVYVGFSKKLYFRSDYLVEMPLEMFRQGNPDDVPLDDVTALVSLYDLPSFKYPETLKEKYGNGIAFPKIPGWGLFGLPFFSIDRESTPYAKDLSYDHVIPLFQTPEGETYASDQHGYLMLYRQLTQSKTGFERIYEKDKSGFALSFTDITTYNLVKSEHKLSIVNEVYWRKGQSKGIRAPFFYDPETNMVYWIRSRIMNFPKSR